MFLENNSYSGSTMVDERISRAIDNDHTAAMKAPSVSKKHLKKKNNADPYNTDMITVCMLCKKAFKNHIFYRKHLRLHAEKTLVCTLCGKVFSKKHHLQGHMLTHSKHQYQCQICHKRFAQKSNFNQHMKFHASNKKVYKCNLCNKDFSQQEHLKAHVRHHNNERPFECELCHKSFNIKSSLQRHMNCHTGEKPFICDICNRGYTRRSVLMLHIQQVHENKKPFQCDECQLCFSQKGNLQAHFRRKHLQPKSDGKRGKDKDGKNKRSLKRQRQRSNAVKASNRNFASHQNSFDEGHSNKVNKARVDNTSLHSYASKVKAIVGRGAARLQTARSSDDQKYSNKSSKSAYSYGKDIINLVQSNGESSYSPTKLDPSSFDSSSSCSLSDDAVDVGCSSSGSDDIPEINFPSILGTHSDEPYDMKALSDFESLLENSKGWEEYLISDTENILSSSLNPEMDVFTSPTKVSTCLTKVDPDDLFSNLAFSDDQPLFTAEDLDEIKDISSICGVNSLIQGSLEGVKFESADQERHPGCNQNSKLTNPLISSLFKTNYAESPTV